MRFQSILHPPSALVCALVAFLLLLPAVNNDSIDMDEAQTWDYARLGSFSEFVTELRADSASEAQQPLGMLAWWGWAKAFGTSEFAMRSINWLWLALALIPLGILGARLHLRWLPLLFAIQPFVWYSMNHARTPMMQIAGGSLLLLGIQTVFRDRQMRLPAVGLLVAGAILLCGASMLGLIPLATVLTGLTLHIFWHRIRLPSGAKSIIFAFGFLLAVLVLYYLTTLARGAGGAKIWAVSPVNLLFVAYEFLGFQGLGPGRQELRSIMRGFSPAQEILPFLPGLIALLVAYTVLTFAAYKSWLTKEFITARPSILHGRVWLLGIGVTLQSGFVLFVLAWVVGFPFWGRHLAGVFPFWLVALGLTLHWARQGMCRKAGRAATWAILFLLCISSALTRLGPFHKHDNYRSAAIEAKRLAAEGKSVWWVADHSGGVYYGVHFDPETEPARGRISFAPNRCDLPGSPPDAIIISRPENFDASGVARNLIRENRYVPTRRLQAFEVWETRPD